eukprot:scaffold803_cov310-Pinguiococcus_pyrenoidosus.AAC.148
MELTTTAKEATPPRKATGSQNAFTSIPDRDGSRAPQQADECPSPLARHSAYARNAHAPDLRRLGAKIEEETCGIRLPNEKQIPTGFCNGLPRQVTTKLVLPCPNPLQLLRARLQQSSAPQMSKTRAPTCGKFGCRRRECGQKSLLEFEVLIIV